MVIVALTLVAAVFQLFFRYEYIHLSGMVVMRVDRLTGTTCLLPSPTMMHACNPEPSPTAAAR